MEQIIVRIAFVVISYCFGMIQMAYIYGKAKGIDIRQHGSGNAGTTNTLRVLGTKAGLVVFFGDVLKTMAAIFICRLIYQRMYPMQYESMRLVILLYAGLGAILGHNYPFYLKFKGGKGIASTAGIILSLNWQFILVGVIAFFTPFVITHYVSLGSLLVYLCFVVELLICGHFGLGDMAVMSQSQKIECYVIALFLMAMAYYKHRANIVRLVKGEERKTYLFKKE